MSALQFSSLARARLGLLCGNFPKRKTKRRPKKVNKQFREEAYGVIPFRVHFSDC
jgi:hypothetical protein